MAEPLHLFTAGEIVEAVAGALTGSPETRLAAVATDTRKIVPGALFVALKGKSSTGGLRGAGGGEGSGGGSRQPGLPGRKDRRFARGNQGG